MERSICLEFQGVAENVFYSRELLGSSNNLDYLGSKSPQNYRQEGPFKRTGKSSSELTDSIASDIDLILM